MAILRLIGEAGNDLRTSETALARRSRKTLFPACGQGYRKGPKRLLPPHLWGRVGVGGALRSRACFVSVARPLTPTLSPLGGEGEENDSLPGEDRLRDHAVDALGAVHYLGNVIIDRDARDHVGLLARKLREALGEEQYGLAHRHLHRVFEVWTEPHHDPVRRSLCPRP